MKHTLHINQMKDEAERQNAQAKLGQVIDLCEFAGCRRSYVLRYLGEPWDKGNCGGCDNCLGSQWLFEEKHLSPKQWTTFSTRQTAYGMGRDCALLLGMKDALAGSGTLNWSETIPVREWEGVKVNLSTYFPRVTELILVGKELTGIVPTKDCRADQSEIALSQQKQIEWRDPDSAGRANQFEMAIPF